MKRVFVVDDNQDVSEMIRFLLTKHNFHVQLNITGLDVLEEVIKCNPDLILMDIALPEKLGTEICKELKHLYSIPIILISAFNKDEEAMKECNADGFIQKPFHLNDLLETINFHLPTINIISL